MDMVEKVARAIKDAMQPKGAEWGGGYEEAARAAISAMREPTEEMVEAGAAADDCAGFDAIWPTMISAALGEEK